MSFRTTKLDLYASYNGDFFSPKTTVHLDKNTDHIIRIKGQTVIAKLPSEYKMIVKFYSDISEYQTKKSVFIKGRIDENNIFERTSNFYLTTIYSKLFSQSQTAYGSLKIIKGTNNQNKSENVLFALTKIVPILNYLRDNTFEVDIIDHEDIQRERMIVIKRDTPFYSYDNIIIPITFEAIKYFGVKNIDINMDINRLPHKISMSTFIPYGDNRDMPSIQTLSKSRRKKAGYYVKLVTDKSMKSLINIFKGRTNEQRKQNLIIFIKHLRTISKWEYSWNFADLINDYERLAIGHAKSVRLNQFGGI